MDARTVSRARPRSGHHRQRGQSLIEAAIALAVLVPLAAGVMLLGQFIHIKLQTQNAAREAAWAATVDPALATGGIPNTATEQPRLRQHTFADANRPLYSGGQGPAQFADPMLTTFAGNPLLKPGDLTLRVYQQQTSPSYLDQAINTIGRTLSQLHLNNTLPPNRQGLVTAEAHASTQTILSRAGRPLNFLGSLAGKRLDFSAKTVLLTDPWDAAGGGETLNGQAAGGAYTDRTVRGVIKPLVPTTWLSGLGSGVRSVAGVLANIPLIGDVVFPNVDHFEMGRTAPDVVPVDKLVK
jgi:hypothetical protein